MSEYNACRFLQTPSCADGLATTSKHACRWASGRPSPCPLFRLSDEVHDVGRHTLEKRSTTALCSPLSASKRRPRGSCRASGLAMVGAGCATYSTSRLRRSLGCGAARAAQNPWPRAVWVVSPSHERHPDVSCSRPRQLAGMARGAPRPREGGLAGEGPDTPHRALPGGGRRGALLRLNRRRRQANRRRAPGATLYAAAQAEPLDRAEQAARAAPDRRRAHDRGRIRCSARPVSRSVSRCPGHPGGATSRSRNVGAFLRFSQALPACPRRLRRGDAGSPEVFRTRLEHFLKRRARTSSLDGSDDPSTRRGDLPFVAWCNLASTFSKRNSDAEAAFCC